MPLVPSHTAYVPGLLPGRFAISPEYFVAISSDSKGLCYFRLPSRREALWQASKGVKGTVPSTLIPLTEITKKRVISAFAFDQRSRLLAILTVEDPASKAQKPRQLTRGTLYFRSFPSGEPHPCCIKGIALDMEKVSGDFDFEHQVRIYGDNVAVVVPTRLMVFNWRTSHMRWQHVCLSKEYQSLSFISDDIILLPNTSHSCISVCASSQAFSGDTHKDDKFRYICELNLPPLELAKRDRALSLRCTSAEGLAGSPSDSIVLVLTIAPLVPGEPETRIKWIVNVKSLLKVLDHQFLSIRKMDDTPRRRVVVPWRLWGLSGTSCFNASSDLHELDLSSPYYLSLTEKPYENNETTTSNKYSEDRYSLKLYTFLQDRMKRPVEFAYEPENAIHYNPEELATTMPRQLVVQEGEEVPYRVMLVDRYGRLFGMRDQDAERVGGTWYFQIEMLQHTRGKLPQELTKTTDNKDTED